MSNYNPIDKCRLCDGELIEFFSLGFQHLANDLIAHDGVSRGQFPITIVRCKNCNLHQQKYDIDPNIIFNADYAYSTPPSLKKHFEELAITVSNQLGLSEFDEVIGIGDNNGTLLSYFKKLGFNVTNIEPSENVARESVDKGINTYVNFFSKEFAENYIGVNPKAKLIVATNVMAHSTSVGDMLDGVKVMLKNDGVFIQENAYLLPIIRGNDPFQFYTEHIIGGWTLGALSKACSDRGLLLYDFTENQIQNGSFRAFISADLKRKVNPQLIQQITLEKFFFDNAVSYRLFRANIWEIGAQIIKYLEFNKFKKIAIYGVTAKVAVMIQYFGIGDYFSYAIDDSKIKQNKFIPGTKIKIFGREKLLEDSPDIIFIGAYNMVDSVEEKIKDWHGELYNPLPEPKVI